MGGPLARVEAHKSRYTNVVIPDNTTDVLLPLQLIFCHPQPADDILMFPRKDLGPSKTP
jgi:hypothetical protein